MRDKPDCEQCRAVKAMFNKEPPCDICMPTLSPYNIDAANIWMIVRDQVITAGISGQVIALNQLALWKLIDEYKVENRIECFEKVRAVFYHLLELDRIENLSKSGDNK